MQDNHVQIVLPTTSIEATTSATDVDDGKKQKIKGASKAIPQKKAVKIKEENRQHKLEKRKESETEQIVNVEDLLKTISADDHAKTIEIIDRSLPDFQTTDSRLKLLRRKFRAQRKYLQNLKRKTNSTVEAQTRKSCSCFRREDKISGRISRSITIGSSNMISISIGKSQLSDTET